MSRTLLLEVFDAALHAVHGQARTAEYLRANPRIGDVHVIAVGKAATAMMHGARDVLGKSLRSGFVVTKHGYEDSSLLGDARIRCLSSGHPVPDAASFAAGQALIEYIAALPRDAFVLVLLSGGASSLMEAPVEGMTVADIQRATDFLLADGWDIGAMNRLRKRWSRLKGGGVLALLDGREVEVLLISDVPGDDPAVIGSGPLWPMMHAELPPLPDWLVECLPPPQPVSLRPVPHRVIATNGDACKAVINATRAHHLFATNGDGPLEGDVLEAASRIAQSLRDAEPGIYVWGGETTVRLPENPGRGGRNQQMALALAIELDGRDDIIVLAAGTDGTDGPGEDAGALIDGQTVSRGQVHALDARRCLNEADSGTFLAASGDLLYTGPTGSNVMDMVIGFIHAPD
ncbi:MAG: DUF4147 domain-containing protein [Gammaproteobacteria bacterium]|nr:DUF4147 domain-containing protein [Gammaproteobacteria bacterium]MCP5136998.1 DUF4147 domain-containing protein [Gammaproteobacteria bacterium]